MITESADGESVTNVNSAENKVDQPYKCTADAREVKGGKRARTSSEAGEGEKGASVDGVPAESSFDVQEQSKDVTVVAVKSINPNPLEAEKFNPKQDQADLP
uniref:Uncharacterized protein n=1 Tax=Leersia perrieri TaxID=77586 RepID=A0A0D9W383_9ORYZ